MNKTYALRAVVVSLLNSVMPAGSKTYFQQAQEDHPVVYAVYTLNLVDNTDERNLYELEVNVMDYGTDTSAIEDLADNIQNTFNKRVEINGDIGVYFYAEQRNAVEEEDRNSLRRRLTFSTYLYER